METPVAYETKKPPPADPSLPLEIVKLARRIHQLPDGGHLLSIVKSPRGIELVVLGEGKAEFIKR